MRWRADTSINEPPPAGAARSISVQRPSKKNPQESPGKNLHCGR